MSLRAAFVGCGPRAREQAAAYRLVRGARLVAACDQDAQRLGDFRDAHRVEAYAEVERMLTAARPDLVHVITPPTARWSVIERLLRAPPRAIIVEKPLALTPSEGERMIDACARAGVALVVNHQIRHQPHWPALREALRAGAIGRARHARASFKGTLLEQGTHLLDLIGFLADDRAPSGSVSALAVGAAGYRTPQAPSPSLVAGVLRLDGLPPIAFEFGASAPAWDGVDDFWLHVGVELTGDRGVAGASLNRGWWVRDAGGERVVEIDYRREDPAAQARLVDEVCAALAAGDRLAALVARQRRSFDLALAMLRSAARRTTVALPARVEDDDLAALRAALEDADAVRVLAADAAVPAGR